MGIASIYPLADKSMEENTLRRYNSPGYHVGVVHGASSSGGHLTITLMSTMLAVLATAKALGPCSNFKLPQPIGGPTKATSPKL